MASVPVSPVEASTAAFTSSIKQIAATTVFLPGPRTVSPFDSDFSIRLYQNGIMSSERYLGLFLNENTISKNPVSKATASVTHSAAIHPIRHAATNDEPLAINLDSSVSIPPSLENSNIPQ